MVEELRVDGWGMEGEEESTSPWPSPPAEREDEESGNRQYPGPAGTRRAVAQAARASCANSLKRVSSPSWADQIARSWPRAMRPWAVSQRSLALGCLANSSRPTSPP